MYIELNVNGVATYHRVHRLIALTHVPNPLGKPFVNHIDGDKRNNHASNLEWVTGTENNLHAVSIGVAGKPRLFYTVKFPNGEVQYLEGMDAVCAATGLSNNSVTNKVKSGRPGRSGHVITALPLNAQRLVRRDVPPSGGKWVGSHRDLDIV